MQCDDMLFYTVSCHAQNCETAGLSVIGAGKESPHSCATGSCNDFSKCCRLTEATKATQSSELVESNVPSETVSCADCFAIWTS